MPIDYSKYPPNWKTEIVPRILLRAENKCEHCGIENKASVWSIPIWMKDHPRYKIKRIWTTDKSCMIRLKSQVCIPDVEGGIKLIKVVLTIAHLDHDETNFDVEDDRLAAMCQSCHLNYDASEKQRRIYAKSIMRQSALV